MDTKEKQDWVEINLSTRKLPVETGWLYETTKGVAWVADFLTLDAPPPRLWGGGGSKDRVFSQ